MRMGWEEGEGVGVVEVDVERGDGVEGGGDGGGGVEKERNVIGGVVDGVERVEVERVRVGGVERVDVGDGGGEEGVWKGRGVKGGYFLWGSLGEVGEEV